jgi:hypothetical protein
MPVIRRTWHSSLNSISSTRLLGDLDVSEAAYEDAFPFVPANSVPGYYFQAKFQPN